MYKLFGNVSLSGIPDVLEKNKMRDGKTMLT